MTTAELLASELRRDGARPLVTFYDDGTGERVELSVATTANWAAKLANLLQDEFGVEPADRVAVLLPTHWETAVVLLGVWTVGASVAFAGPARLTFCTAERASDATGDVVELTLEPFGAGLARVVAGQPDRFAPLVPVDPASEALAVDGRTWSHADLGDAAVHAASGHGLGRGCRVLCTLRYDTVDGLDAGLLVPLAAGGSVVLVARPDPDRLPERCAVEHVTHTAGVDVAGLPRLD